MDIRWSAGGSIVTAPTTPPQNLEAEESVLGAMMLSARAIEEVGEILSSNDFYRTSYGTIFQAALDMAAAEEPVDAVTLADKLQRIGKLHTIGGPSKIAELAALVPAASNVQHYARIVANESARRSLVTAGLRITESAQKGGDVADLIASAEAHLSAATVLRSPTNVVPITADLADYRAELFQAYSTKTPMFGLRTGFADLDDTLLGIWPGQLVLIAARPGQGKSALALNIAENFADRTELVLFVSLEMGRRELLIRSLARESKIDGKRLQTGLIEDNQTDKLRAAITTIEGRGPKLLVEDTSSLTLPELRAVASRLKRQADLKLIVVDYLQLMQGAGETRSEQVGSLSRGLKMLARQLDIPIIALSQMNRAIETRNEKRPVLSDLRDSGSLEQDSDVVLFLHDDASYDPGKEADGSIELIVAKNRKGETGGVKLNFLRRFTAFQTPSSRPGGPNA